MEGVIVSYAQFMQRLKYDIYTVFQSYRHVYIHRAKLACLCSDLSPFHKFISTQKFSDDPPQPNEAASLRNLVTLMGNLKTLFSDIDQNNAVSTLVRQPTTYVRDELRRFRKEFNEQVAILKVYDSQPCPYNANQEIIDDNADLVDVTEKISLYLEQNRSIIPQDIVTVLDLKLSAMKKDVEEYINKTAIQNNEQSARNRQLTTEEINAKLSGWDKWSLQHKDFEVQKKIGSGGFADVFLGLQKSSKVLVAIKKLHNESFTQQSFEMFQREVEIFGTLKHYAILPFVGVCLAPPFYIVTEYMPGGCLFNRLHSKTGKLDPTKRTIIALGIASALSYIHSRKMIHRDIKSLNVLLDADDYPRLCDFGMSRSIPKGEHMTGGIGTAQWMAPEILNADDYTEKADVYSFGILLWELLTCDVPFRGMKEVQVAMAVVGNGARPPIPQDCPPKLSKFIKLCWDTNPSQRPSMDNVVKCIASGEMIFPGTNMEFLQAYVTRFSEKVNTDVISLQASESSSQDLIQQLEGIGDPTPALNLLELSITDDKWSRFIFTPEYIVALSHVCYKCKSSQVAKKVINILNKITEIDEKLITVDAVNAVLNVFSKYGNTQMTQVVDIVERAIAKNVQGIFISVSIAEKIALFLQATNADARVKASNLLYTVIEHKAYDKISVLETFICNVLSNSSVENMEELIVISLKLFNRLIDFDSFVEVVINLDGVATLAHIITQTANKDIKNTAAGILAKLVKSGKIPDSSISKYLNEFGNASTRLEGVDLSVFLGMLTCMISSPSSYILITGCDSFGPSLRKCLLKKDVENIIISLKILYIMLQNGHTKHIFDEIAIYEPLKLLIGHENPAIGALVACCLMVIPPELYEKTYYTVEVQQYLLRAFSKETEYTPYALRLAGVISKTKLGVDFLDNGLMEYIYMISIKSENLENVKLTYMVYASFANTNPFASFNTKLVNLCIRALGNKDYGDYPSIFIAAVAINPDAATLCAESFTNLVSQFIEGIQQFNAEEDDKNSLSVCGALMALKRITSCPEALPNIRDSTPIILLYKAAAFVFNTYLYTDYLEVVDIISGSIPGRRALRETELMNLIEHKLISVEQNARQRPLLLRILARCQASKS